MTDYEPATITAHHLYLTGEQSNVDPFAFCKPIPKTPADRDALLQAVCSGDPKFFLYVHFTLHDHQSTVDLTTSTVVPIVLLIP